MPHVTVRAPEGKTRRERAGPSPALTRRRCPGYGGGEGTSW